MKILVTGANGFIGKNLIAHLHCRGYEDILSCDIDTPPELLDRYAGECGFVFHLAGVNRPDNPDDFIRGNAGATSDMLSRLKKHGNKAPVLLASSVQSELDNPYGRSKKAAEEILSSYARDTGADVLIYRLPNVFGKWCRPNYNSVVATFCHNIAHDLPIRIDDAQKELSLVYIDDIAGEFIRALEGSPNRRGNFCHVEPVHVVKLGRIAELLQGFRDSRSSLDLPDMSEIFTQKLYATFLSYVSADKLISNTDMKYDSRGFFVELIKSPRFGQISISRTKPGIVRGNHWHNTKTEKFIVIEGEAVIRLRKLNLDEIYEYHVSANKIEIIDIPPGYTHNIENTGNTDLITIFWANELFNADASDTHFSEV